MSVAVEKKVVTCKKKYKDDFGTEHECGTVLKGECSKKDRHIHPFVTGFCAVGAHEGVQKLGANGRPLKSCHYWQNCPCTCHKMFDMMYSQSGMRREIVDTSGYEPEVHHFKMPTLEERAAMMAVQKEKVSRVEEILEESPLPDVIPASFRHKFVPTPTGRAARGELESFVKKVCDEFIVEKYKVLCTPSYVAEQVAKIRDGAPPSQGAINAVFDRWVRVGFAIIEHKPTRFVGYTPDGIKYGLEALRLRSKEKHTESPAAQFQRRSQK